MAIAGNAPISAVGMPARSSSFVIVAPQRWQLPHPDT
jgi:hypothetical protein